MKLQFTATKLTKVSDVKISDRFYNRIRIGNEKADKMFGGQGLLPGSTFTLAGVAGGGKTTLMLQYLERTLEHGYKAGYATGEEATEQLAFNCERLGVENLPIANASEIHDILQMVDDSELDILLLDSFQAITVNPELTEGVLETSASTRKRQEYIANAIIKKAQSSGCAIGCIVHITSTGTMKGGTALPHAVDANFMIEVDSECPEVRTWSPSKNRFGSIEDVQFIMNTTGMDIDSDISEMKAENNKLDLLTAMNNICAIPGEVIATRQFTNHCEGSYTKGQTLINELLKAQFIKQEGRGKYIRLDVEQGINEEIDQAYIESEKEMADLVTEVEAEVHANDLAELELT